MQLPADGFLVTFSLLALIFPVAISDPLVPALCIFGDSVVDVGNNNNLLTVVKANFPPYGRDFVTHTPTGRFCNGKLATDFTAEFLGFSSYPPAYLSQDATGNKLLTGANFASAASGFYDGTAQLYHAISLTQQLNYYKEYQSKVVNMVGTGKGNAIFSGGIHLLSAGSSDFIQNYYVNPLLCRTYSPQQFSDILITSYSNFIQNLYGLGARRIGVTGLPPLGCLPAAITLFGSGSNQCIQRLNQDAIAFNTKLQSTSQSLQNRFSDLKLVVFDIYQPLLNMVSKPAENGFFEARRACCGTGTVETSLLCNSGSIGTCSNATGYVFWDGFHPTEAANQVKIIGVEPSDANAMALSLCHGQRIILDIAGGFADGVAVKEVGEETFRLCKDLMDGVVLVSRDAICASIKDMFEEKRSILEPAGALSLAGAEAYCKYYGLKGENVVVITSGANMNFDKLRIVTELANVGREREAVLATIVPEKPGSFKRFCELVGPMNITEFKYRYNSEKEAVVLYNVGMHMPSELEEMKNRMISSQLETYNLTNNDLVKDHLRYLMGGKSNVENEVLCRFIFPERPGALEKFLDAFSPRWNISLFHYRGQGETGANILVGFQIDKSDMGEFHERARRLGYEYVVVTDDGVFQLLMHT